MLIHLLDFFFKEVVDPLYQEIQIILNTTTGNTANQHVDFVFLFSSNLKQTKQIN